MTRTLRALLVLTAALFAALALCACSHEEPAPPSAPARATKLAPRPKGPPQTILLVALDQACAARMTIYDATRDTTPGLARMAQKGVVFDKNLTPSLATNASLASVLTGVSVRRHGLHSVRALGHQRLPPDVPTLAEAFRAKGFRTLAAVSLRQLSASVSGLERGFDRYQDGVAPASGAPASAGAVVAALLPELDAALASESSVFALLHLGDLRPNAAGTPRRALEYLARGLAPYRDKVDGLAELLDRAGLAPAAHVAELAKLLGRRRGSPALAAFEESLYDATLRDLDDTLVELVARIEARGRLARSTVVVIGLQGRDVGFAAEPELHGFSNAVVRTPMLLCDQRGLRRWPYPSHSGLVFHTLLAGSEEGAGDIFEQLPRLDFDARFDREGVVESPDLVRRMRLGSRKYVLPDRTRKGVQIFDALDEPVLVDDLEPATREHVLAELEGVRCEAALEDQLVLTLTPGGDLPLEIVAKSPQAGLVEGRVTLAAAAADPLAEPPPWTRVEVSARGERASATLVAGAAPVRLVLSTARPRTPLSLELTRGGKPLAEELVVLGGRALAAAPLLRLPDPLGEPWEAGADGVQPWQVDLARREPGWVELQIGGALPAGVRVRALVERYPPGDPSRALVAEAGPDVRVAPVTGRLDALCIEGVTPLVARLALAGDERPALSVALDGRPCPASEMRYLGRRFGRGALVVWVSEWLAGVTDDLFVPAGADPLAGAPSGALVLERVGSGLDPARASALAPDDLAFVQRLAEGE